MKNKKSKIVVILTQILQFGPAAGVVAYYSQDFFEGSAINISAGIIFLAILILLRIKSAVAKVMDLPGGTGLALFMAIFSGICLIIGEEIWYVSVTYLASSFAAMTVSSLNTIPEDTVAKATLLELQKMNGTVKK